MIFRIFRKELLDTLRDRRTLMTMLVIPILVFPITLNVFVEISKSFEEDEQQKTLKVGVFGTNSQQLKQQLQLLPESLGKKTVVIYSDSLKLDKDVKAQSIDLGLYHHYSTDQKTLILDWQFDATEIGRQERAEAFNAAIESIEQQKRLKALGIRIQEIEPVKANYKNCASNEKMVGKLAGGFLPYIFIAFGFIGCMYPAIDLFTGEKERGTIETLLTTPVARWKILLGKMMVVVLSGMLAASCSLLGLFISIEFLDLGADKELLNVIHSILTVPFVLSMLSLLLPLVIFFAGVMIPIAVYAKSFKEAQSIITPLNIVMVLPAMIGFFPGIELNLKTAFIPVVNVVLATKELIAGTLGLGYFVCVFGVMCSMAFLAILLSYRQFGKEQNILS
ncbi:MAG: ABC transporter permease subunit [Crocinitomicaceae bacterium]